MGFGKSKFELLISSFFIIIIIIIIIIITKIYIAHMPDGKINSQMESEAQNWIGGANVCLTTEISEIPLLPAYFHYCRTISVPPSYYYHPCYLEMADWKLLIAMLTSASGIF